MIVDIYGYKPEFEYDITKPIAIPTRQIDITKIKKLGWRPTISIKNGFKRTIMSFLEN